MKFTKKELNVLDLYAVCCDQKGIGNDKFQIKVKGDDVTLSQFSDEVTLITTFKKQNDAMEDFSIIFPTTQFSQLMKAIPDSGEVEISSKGLEFKNNKYELSVPAGIENWFANTDHFLTLVSDTNMAKKVVISDFQKNNIVRSYMGADGLDTLALMDGYFITSNRSDVTAATLSGNPKMEDFYISKLTVFICNMFKYDMIEFYEYEEKGIYVFKVDNTFIIVNKKEYILPNIFSDAIREAYDHKDKFTVSKADLKDSLARIKVVASNNLDGRIYITTTNNKLLIESKDTGYAKEELECTYDSALEGHSIILSVNYLSSIVSSLSGETVIVNVLPDPEAVAVKVSDEKEESLFVHCLYTYN